MKSAIAALMMLSLLTACGGATFSDEARIALPDVIEYSRDVQNKAADELLSCQVPTITEFMKDYHVMREQARRARGR